jgi:hypothetical protein
MISTLNLHLSKYGCQGVSTVSRAPLLQELSQDDCQSPVKDPILAPELERIHTPKLDMKKFSAATKKVLNQQLRETSDAHDLVEDICELPLTPQPHCAQLESSSPETPTLSRTNLNYFQVLRSKPIGPHRESQTLIESPETVPVIAQVRSTSSTPEPHTPDLTVSLNTTTLKSVVLVDQKVNLAGAFGTESGPTAGTVLSRCSLSDSDQGCESEDDLNEMLNLSLDAFSPPKTSKILQPRKNQPASHGWIPIATDAEWLNAPVFLQRQVDFISLRHLTICSIGQCRSTQQRTQCH